jgi:hypothetical protein
MIVTLTGICWGFLLPERQVANLNAHVPVPLFRQIAAKRIKRQQNCKIKARRLPAALLFWDSQQRLSVPLRIEFKAQL